MYQAESAYVYNVFTHSKDKKRFPKCLYSSGWIKKEVVGGRHWGAEGRLTVKYRDWQPQWGKGEIR